jgi:hypothetical protein
MVRRTPAACDRRRYTNRRLAPLLGGTKMTRARPSPKNVHRELWLYPISETSGYYFSGNGVKTDDTSFESFAKIMEESKGNPGDDLWGVHQNRKHVHVGDEIVVYSCATKDHPPLLVGLATVAMEADWVPEWEKWAIEIRWNRRTSLALCRSPVDATYLKDRLPSRKASVVSLTPDLQRWVRAAIARIQGKPRRSLN